MNSVAAPAPALAITDGRDGPHAGLRDAFAAGLPAILLDTAGAVHHCMLPA
jgi:hypothetical protein